MKSIRKPKFTILEVIIAFFLVSACMIPLIYPHQYFYRLQVQFVETLQCDRLAAAAFAHILEKLHKQEIPFKEIEEKAILQIPASVFSETSSPLTGIYQFKLLKDKTQSETSYSVKLFTVDLIFSHVHDPTRTFPYSYEVVIIHDPNHTGGPKKEEKVK